MGNDGGSIPTRRELVKEAAKNPSATELKESQHEQQEYYWTTDPISQEPLSAPVVSDCSGKLYNKATVLEYLVEEKRKEDFERITDNAVKSLKDVVEIKFETEDDEKSWKCPVTGDKLGPGSKAVYIVPCGHAFSGSAIKEVSGEKCLTCETEYASNDIIPILPTSSTDIARLALRAKTLQEKGLTHSLKKAGGGKKRKKMEKPETAKKEEAETNGINNASTASLTAKVMQEQERAKKRRLESENVRSLFSAKEKGNSMGKNSDFMTRGFSVPSTSKR